MITSETQLAPLPEPTPIFPLLARLKDAMSADHRGTVVLFTGPKEGFVVASPKTGRPIGKSEQWVDCHDFTVWDILPKGSSVNLIQG